MYQALWLQPRIVIWVLKVPTENPFNIPWLIHDFLFIDQYHPRVLQGRRVDTKKKDDRRKCVHEVVLLPLLGRYLVPPTYHLSLLHLTQVRPRPTRGARGGRSSPGRSCSWASLTQMRTSILEALYWKLNKMEVHRMGKFTSEEDTNVLLRHDRQTTTPHLGHECSSHSALHDSSALAVRGVKAGSQTQAYSTTLRSATASSVACACQLGNGRL